MQFTPQQMAGSDAAWQVLGQQVLMQSMAIPAELLLNPGDPALLDKYAAPLQKLATGTAFADLGVEEAVDALLSPREELGGGAWAMFEPTSALVAIDVNTGGFVGVKNFEETIFKTNLEAAQAAARQLRLRNLGGIIIIDFIDMTQESHREAVVVELKKHLRRDRTKTMVGEFSPLGLLEVTRKRTRESLSQILSDTCPTCHGRGAVKTARTVCYEILRELLTEARNFNPTQFTVIAHPRVVAMLEEEESGHLSDLCDFVGKPVSLQADTSLSPEHYDIVLR